MLTRCIARVLPALLVLAVMPLVAVLGSPPTAVAAVGAGFTVTPSDLAFILKQIKIAEHHAATYTADNPCGTLVGPGPHQIHSPLLSYGLRTVDGSCNNLVAGHEGFGAADRVFPRLTTQQFRDADPVPAGFPGAGTPTSYKSKSGFVFDSEPRMISNLIVDQTAANPAAVAAAAHPLRSQSDEGVVPCASDPSEGSPGVPAGCVPSGETLPIPNVPTDVGLSPPYNALFTIFGQFFDHGVDLTTKDGGTVFVPLKDDDPLVAGPDHRFGTADDLPPNQRFMVLTRAQNEPGPDGVLGDDPTTPDVDESADDVHEATNTDSPWADQSQTYTSHPSHQVFIRQYELNAQHRPVSTGKLLGSVDGGMATWALVKQQAAAKLGLRLVDQDILNVPLIAADPYGKFIPGPAHGLPQYVTAHGLVEGNLADPVPVPADARRVADCAPGVSCNEGFVVDIAHNAVPGLWDDDHDPSTPKVPLRPDDDHVASTDFASQPAGTYDDELLDAHFCAGDGRVNENIALTAIHQIFHSEHDRLVEDIKRVLLEDTSDTGTAVLAEWTLPADVGAAATADEGVPSWNGERLFQAARFITEMEYQHIVFEEFARKIAPSINPFEPFAFTQADLNPSITAEFAQAVYRFGHSMLTDSIDRINGDGSHNDIDLMDAFLNPPAYTQKTPGGSSGALTSEQAAGSILMGLSDETGSELDEFVTQTLRNNLLGLPLDLATINIARARETGIPPLNEVRREIWQATNDGQLKPYTSWLDFGQNMKHPESLVNFVAAYGEHPTVKGVETIDAKRTAASALVYGEAGPDGAIVDDPITPEDETADNVPPTRVPADRMAFLNGTGGWASKTGGVTTTGVDGIDLWVGGLAERTNLFGGLLGSTFNYVFENQLTDLQNGDRFYYLARTQGMNLLTQLESNSFAELIMRNTDAHSLKADAFTTSDCKFELANLAGTAPGYTQFGNTVADDPASGCDERALLVRMPDGTIRYRVRNGVDPAGINGQSVYNGTSASDRVWGGVDDDTFWGNEGDDVIEGNDGADVALGGDGDDTITDSAGDDTFKGGPGDDALDAGPGLDVLLGGAGKDFTNGGANANETFAGEGDDMVIAGQGQDTVFGDGGSDWEEGGDQPDLLQGDAGNLFFLDDGTRPGHDILIGQGSDDDYDFEGGDDIGLSGPGIEKVAGAAGYDWEIGQGDPQPQDMDLDLPLPGLDEVLLVDVRDRFNEVEALSGWKFDDTLKGDGIAPARVGEPDFLGCDALDQAGLDRISGLDAIVPPLTTPVSSVVANAADGRCPLRGPVWGDGNILLGGGGSDTIFGRSPTALAGDGGGHGADDGTETGDGSDKAAAATTGDDDIIDGDRYLSVRLSVRTDPADPSTEIGSASPTGPGQSAMTSQYLRDTDGSLTGPALQQAVFNGTVDPGDIVPVREIKTANNPGDVDTAAFSDVRDAYECTIGTGVPGPCPLTLPAGVPVTVAHDFGAGVDGTDTLRNIERLRFSDTVAPDAPTIGVPVPGDGAVTVRWIPPGNVAVTRYEIEALDQAGNTLATRSTDASGDSSLVVTGLTNGQAYRFRVRGVNEFGAGAFSRLSVPVTPDAGLVRPPGAPAVAHVVAGNHRARVRWSAPIDDGGSAITGYVVRVVDSFGTQVARRRTDGTDTSLTVGALDNGSAYRLQVAAVNAAGTGPMSALSDWVIPIPTTPTAPGIRRPLPRDGHVVVRWTRPDSAGGSALDGYRVRVLDRSGRQLGRLRRTAPSARRMRTGRLANGVAYRFQVAAVNAMGRGRWSSMSRRVRPRAVPRAPVLRRARPGRRGGVRTATARWRRPRFNGGARVTGYTVVALRMTSDGVGRRIKSPKLRASARRRMFRLPPGRYRFRIVAWNRAGRGRWSARTNRVVAR